MKSKIRLWSPILLALMGVSIIFSSLLRPSIPLGGTDERATQAIQTLAPHYRPWFSSPFPPSEELESLLFLLQASLAAGGVGYVLGRYQERFYNRAKPPEPPQEQDR